MRKIRRSVFIVIACICGFLIVITGMIFAKKWQVNPLIARRYDLQGIDVSHYQGEIDWVQIRNQGIDFAFIKATEGSGYVDEKFHDNWQAVSQTDLYAGAYHFFSFDSDAQTQAELFIDTVGSLHGKIAPAIDIEYYGDKYRFPPEKEEVVRELQELLRILEEHYKIKPIIYTTYPVYHKYIKDTFSEYPLWIRNVYYPPGLNPGNRFLFWQYTDTAILDGYDGTEKYVDRNVFCGMPEEFEQLIAD